MAGSDELVVGKFDPYSDELAITQDHSVIAHVYGSDAGTVKAMALDFVLGRERAQKAEAEKARLTAQLAERDAEIARLREAGDAMDAALTTSATVIRDACKGVVTVEQLRAYQDKAGASMGEWRAALAARGGEDTTA